MIYPTSNGQKQSPAALKQLQITGRDYLSYSEVAAYQKCPLQWWYRYVANEAPEEISAALILGSGVHAAIEHHFQQLLQAGVLPEIEELMEVFDACWEKESKELPVTFPKGQDRDSIRATAERMLKHFMDSPQAMPEGQLIGIEETFRVKLADDLPALMGRIDVVTWLGSDLQITDFKTARSMWTAATAQENADQLMLYSLGMKDLARTLNEKAGVELRFVVLTKTKQPKIASLPVKLDQDRLNRTQLTVRRVVTSMQQAVENESIYPSPSQYNCATCPYTAACRQWHQT